MPRRPASSSTAAETRRTRAGGHPEASSANFVPNFSGPDPNEAVLFHRLLRARKGTQGYNAYRAWVDGYLGNGMPFEAMALGVANILDGDRDLIRSFNRCMYPFVHIPVPMQNLRRARIFFYGRGER